MRSRRSANETAAEVARRRLELLSAELAAIRPDPGAPPTPAVEGGSGEPTPGPPPPAQQPAEVRGRHARRRVTGVTTGWVEDRLPPTLQGRVRVGASQLTVVAVMVAAALGLLAWWSVRAADPGELVPTRSFTTTPTTHASPSPSAAAPAPAAASAPAAAAGPSGGTEAALVVDVAGKVRRPGIVRLPAGSRVVDAIDEAGGARRGVDLTGLNLARLLVDGEQVLVGVGAVGGVAPEAAAGPVASPAPLVNLNTADAGQLDTLPGVGPVTAAAILQWRAEHGAFNAVEELLEVSGIGDATLAELAPFVTL
jgi:competence protein ComEA